MRRNAACFVVCSLIVLLSGCKSNKTKNETSLTAYDPYAYDPAVDQPKYEPLELPSHDPAPAVAAQPVSNWTATSVNDTAPAGSTRYHTVAKKETLYSLARQYYGDQSKWRDIYETNRTTISDPNKIRVGQRLLIP